MPVLLVVHVLGGGCHPEGRVGNPLSTTTEAGVFTTSSCKSNTTISNFDRNNIYRCCDKGGYSQRVKWDMVPKHLLVH